MKKFLFAFVFSFFLVNAYSQESDSPFSLDLKSDCIIGISGLTLNGTTFLCDNILELNRNSFDGNILDKNDINSFDRFFMNPYSDSLNMGANILVGLGIITPCILLTEPKEEWLTLGVMYAETLLLANGCKELGKFAVNRARPYMYFDGYPLEKVEDGDWEKSWPSGHTTFAFASAAFLSYTYYKYNPDSKWNYIVTGGSFLLAGTTGALRVASGNHFATDVLTGALIGTACGLFVPWFHTINTNEKIQAQILPAGLAISIRF